MVSLKQSWPLLALSVLFWVVVAFGASIYGSYRYEPSGIQYAFLPFLAAPACLVLALALLRPAHQARASVLVRLIPFVAAVVLSLPAFGMFLSDRNLEAARWATIALGVAHALLLFLDLRRLGLWARQVNFRR